MCQRSTLETVGLQVKRGWMHAGEGRAFHLEMAGVQSWGLGWDGDLRPQRRQVHVKLQLALNIVWGDCHL